MFNRQWLYVMNFCVCLEEKNPTNQQQIPVLYSYLCVDGFYTYAYSSKSILNVELRQFSLFASSFLYLNIFKKMNTWLIFTPLWGPYRPCIDISLTFDGYGIPAISLNRTNSIYLIRCIRTVSTKIIMLIKVNHLKGKNAINIRDTYNS